MKLACRPKVNEFLHDHVLNPFTPNGDKIFTIKIPISFCRNVLSKGFHLNGNSIAFRGICDGLFYRLSPDGWYFVMNRVVLRVAWEQASQWGKKAGKEVK